MKIQVLILPFTGLFLFLSACTVHHTTTTYWNRAAGIRKEQGTAYFITGKDGAAKEIRDGKWTTWHRNTKKTYGNPFQERCSCRRNADLVSRR